MLVRLKVAAQVPGRGLVQPNTVLDWPEGSPPPSTARKLTKAEAAEFRKAEKEAAAPTAPVALSELSTNEGLI